MKIEIYELSESSQNKFNEIGKTISVRDFINDVFYEGDFNIKDITPFCRKNFKVSQKWIKTHTNYSLLSSN